MEIEIPNNRTETLIFPWCFPLGCGLKVHVPDFFHKFPLGTQGIVHLSLESLTVPRTRDTLRSVELWPSKVLLMLPVSCLSALGRLPLGTQCVRLQTQACVASAGLSQEAAHESPAVAGSEGGKQMC